MPLQKWFLAVMLMLNAKKGLSALQLSRDLSVNKNTAWRITMQIRKAMTQAEQRNLLTGIVEMDETYVGGKPRKGTKGDGDDGKHKTGRGTKKAPVIGAVERGGNVTAKAVAKDKMKGRHMRAFVRDHIDTSKASLITDEYKAYLGMAKVLPHAVIKHADWYVDGDIHTNTIEGFWALLKRGMFGQFHSVSRRHLQRYVDEFLLPLQPAQGRSLRGLRSHHQSRTRSEGMSKKPLKVVAGAPDRPLVIGGVEIPCYVLEDETRVLSQRGLQTGIGMGSGGPRRNIGAPRMAEFIQGLGEKGTEINDLTARLTSPIEFQPPTGGRTAYAYPAELLVEVCEIILDAYQAKVLHRQQETYCEARLCSRSRPHKIRHYRPCR